ncbi:MAG: transcriptional repressor [Pirellulaceae bacterium]|nr:transcriptional repressor [Pirellulaceae bacterium]
MTRSTHQEMSVKDARAALRAAKLRSTTSRVAVLQHLSTADKPLSHSEVADELVPTGFDKSTLYRCLVELADAGLLSRLDAGDHSWRFELRRGDGHEGGEHPHFVCTDCGTVTCLPDVEVKIAPAKGTKNSRLGDVTEIFLKGTCPECTG